ncbi:MAG TPA: flippase-like domain-containing protein [Acidimicrobiia bacterium]
MFTGYKGRVRRPRDVIMAVVGTALTIWAVAAVDRLPDWAISLTELVATAPDWVTSLLAVGYLLSLLYSVVVLGGVVLRAKTRNGALRDVILVVTISVALAVLLSWLVNRGWPYFLPEIDLENAEPRFPVTRVTVVTGLLVVVSTYLTRPLRRFGWLAILITAIAAVGLGYGSPIHVMGSFGLGLAAAGLLQLAVGTPRGYPAPDAVAQGLAGLGVPSTELKASADQTWGLVRFDATGTDGTAIDLKVYGRDAFDSQLAAKLWRTLIYKEMSRTISYSRLQTVEHEALVSLMAARRGVSVPDLLAVGNASAEIALIAFAHAGEPLAVLEPEAVSDDFLVAVWRQVGTMHGGSVSHGRLNTKTVSIANGSPVFTDFDLGSLAPGDDDRAGDTVELLFSLSLLVGHERAVRTALDGLGRDSLIAVLPYLQVPAVSATSRRQVDKPKQIVNALRDEILEMTGATAPPRVELRRVTLKSLGTVLLLLLVAYALLPLLTEVDYAQIWDVLQSADWMLLVLGVIVGHLQFFPSATATMFAVPATLPFWPLVTLQTASQFISLAIPSSAGRVAMNAAFLHKFGVPVTVALAQGAIDGFSGFLVQVLILLVVLLTGDVDLGLSIDPSDLPWLIILAVVVGVVALAVLLVLRVQKLREKVLPVVKQAWGALMVVLRQPSRALGLLGSNFVYWNTLGLTLWVLLDAIGSPIGYGSALFVAVGTSLFAGFMPVPGGVGVAEATMVALLATFGVDQAAAFAATAVYRAATFYLPAIEGMFGTRWLRSNDYI